jgi:hypothetical protein
MRVLVLEPAAREQRVCRDQRLDDGLVGVALLAVVVDDAGRAAVAVRPEARRVLGEEAGVVHGERDCRVDAARGEVLAGIHPRIEVLAAVAGRGVDEAGAGVVGDMVAGQHRDREGIAAAEAIKWVRKCQHGEFIGRYAMHAFVM